MPAANARANDCLSKDVVNVGNGYLNGHGLREMTDRDLASYAMGYIDALVSGNMFGMNRACLTMIAECTKGRSNTQLAAMTRKFLKDNPERWHERANMLLYEVILRRCMFPEAK